MDVKGRRGRGYSIAHLEACQAENAEVWDSNSGVENNNAHDILICIRYSRSDRQRCPPALRQQRLICSQGCNLKS